MILSITLIWIVTIRGSGIMKIIKIKMKTVALVLLSLVVLAQAETESPLTFIEGFIRGLQPDIEDNSACRIAYAFIQSTGLTTIQNFSNAPTDLVEGVRAFENVIRTMEYMVSAIE